MSRVLRKLGLMHLRKVSSQMSLCSPQANNRLIRDDAYRFYGQHRHILDDTSIKHRFPRVRLRGLMHVRKVSSQISLCSPHRLIRDEPFRFCGIFRSQKVSS